MRTHLRVTGLAGIALLAVACTLGNVGCAASNDPDESNAGALQSARPPQYVLMAFDGSLSLDFWEESLTFAKGLKAANKPLDFTYFISGTYFIPDALKADHTKGYKAPHALGWGKSAIGFGGLPEKIRTRVDYVDRAATEGHEIASHANGHFDGSSWTYEDWKSEFEQFDSIFFGERAVKRLSKVSLADVVGFRAPQLGHSPGLFQVLAERHYTYDTSKSSAPNYWPQKINGVWNMPLAQLRIVGSGKKTLSMDYNFYVADSRGVADAANAGRYRKQMVDTYRAYFASNYYGNRAPIHIGHHFSKWNGGAYWSAMQDFAKDVCGKPEVKCVTYKEYISYLEGLSLEQRTDFKNGAFPKLERPSNGDSESDVPESFFYEPAEGELVGDNDDAHEKEEDTEEVPTP